MRTTLSVYLYPNSFTFSRLGLNSTSIIRLMNRQGFCDVALGISYLARDIFESHRGVPHDRQDDSRDLLCSFSLQRLPRIDIAE